MTGEAAVERHVRVLHGHRRALLVAGSGPSVLLVHGIGDSSATWRDVAPLLAEHHTVIAPDLLGHGASDRPRADYPSAGSPTACATCWCCSATSAPVVGHSLGGGIALQFA